ncbi:MAG: TAXI family TRAP transporter solute-binding subunit [Anaerolineae bacterium]|nr:TAXI family TRAP transporter solute-binding subunit [Anaerolineae bacterium]
MPTPTQLPAPTEAPTMPPPAPTVAPTEAPTVAPTEAPTATPLALTGIQAPCTPENATDPYPSGKVRLVIGTGGTGGVFYPYGGGIARILSEKMPNTEATAEVTGGSVDNNKLLAKGEIDIGFSTLDSAFEASRGSGVYQDVGPVPLCTIATLYQSFVHIVALEESGINSVEDMKGKRVSIGSAGSSTEVAARRILELAGINPDADIQRENLGVSESVNAIKDRKIDAFFWIGGLPTAAVKDLVSTPGIKVKFIGAGQYVDKLREKHGPLYVRTTLSKEIYNLESDVEGIGIGNALLVNAKANEQLVYDILKTIFDNLEEVKSVHPEARKLSLETAVTGSSVPFHPGAIRFYTERGVWKP